MLYKDVVDLVRITIIKDKLHQERKIEERNQVFADRKSISQTEFYSAGNSGFNPQYVFSIRMSDYNFEESLYYNNYKYSIYRTYQKGEFIELYTHKKVGE